MATSTVTSRGQTTIPQQIRESKHLQEGDRIEWVEQDNGRIEVIPVNRDAANVAGLFQDWVTSSVSTDEMCEAVKTVAASKFHKGQQ